MTVRCIGRLVQTLNYDKDTLEEGRMAVSKIPVRAWLVVIEPKPSNIIVFFPFSAYIMKTLHQASCSGNSYKNLT